MTTSESSAISCPEQRVEEAWIDYNGHLNMAFYHVMFDRAVDHVYNTLGVGADYVTREQGSCFTMEVHVNYLNELVLDDPVLITFQLLAHDSKRLHFFQEMRHAGTGELAATSEQLALHVNMQQRRSTAFPADRLAAISTLMQAHQQLAYPSRAGGRISIRRSE